MVAAIGNKSFIQTFSAADNYSSRNNNAKKFILNNIKPAKIKQFLAKGLSSLKSIKSIPEKYVNWYKAQPIAASVLSSVFASASCSWEFGATNLVGQSVLIQKNEDVKESVKNLSDFDRGVMLGAALGSVIPATFGLGETLGAVGGGCFAKIGGMKKLEGLAERVGQWSENNKTEPRSNRVIDGGSNASNSDPPLTC